MSCNKRSSIRSFQSHANPSKEYKNIKIKHPQLILCKSYVDFQMRPVQYKKITITNVDGNILN